MRYRQRKERATIPEEEWRNGTEQRNTVDTMSVLIIEGKKLFFINGNIYKILFMSSSLLYGFEGFIKTLIVSTVFHSVTFLRFSVLPELLHAPCSTYIS